MLSACSKSARIAEAPADRSSFLHMSDTLGMTRVDITSPMQEGRRIARYYLVKHHEEPEPPVPADGIAVEVPIRHFATTSATHVGYLKALGCLDSIVCMATPELVYNRPSHPVVNIGSDYQLNVEQVLLARPDVLIATQYGMQIGGIEQVQQAGIPVIYMVEWLEQSPLGRADWLRLFGALTCREETADSLLRDITARYHTLQQESRSHRSRPRVAYGQSFRGTWYVPSGRSYMQRLLQDAGADYYYAERTEEGSIPLTIEEAILSMGDADIWLGVNADNLSELEAIDTRHTWMQPFRNHNVWNWKGAITPQGGSDFWETGILRPDLILADLIYALYPEQLPSDYRPAFICRLPD